MNIFSYNFIFYSINFIHLIHFRVNVRYNVLWLVHVRHTRKVRICSRIASFSCVFWLLITNVAHSWGTCGYPGTPRVYNVDFCISCVIFLKAFFRHSWNFKKHFTSPKRFWERANFLKALNIPDTSFLWNLRILETIFDLVTLVFYVFEISRIIFLTLRKTFL